LRMKRFASPLMYDITTHFLHLGRSCSLI
jgi:hypothetical protein